jgi:hypothetical protein
MEWDAVFAALRFVDEAALVGACFFRLAPFEVLLVPDAAVFRIAIVLFRVLVWDTSGVTVPVASCLYVVQPPSTVRDLLFFA